MNFEGGMQDVGYDSALSLIIDIRTVIPGSGTTAPVGWAALPLFQTGPGRYMASGYYHLPIFKVCYFVQLSCVLSRVWLQCISYVVHASSAPGCCQSCLQCISCAVYVIGASELSAHLSCLPGPALW